MKSLHYMNFNITANGINDLTWLQVLIYFLRKDIYLSYYIFNNAKYLII